MKGQCKQIQIPLYQIPMGRGNGNTFSTRPDTELERQAAADLDMWYAWIDIRRTTLADILRAVVLPPRVSP